MKLHVVNGDLLEQDVDVIVNPWNRNLIPWWLLLPQGVSGAIKRRGGREPFKELRRAGVLGLGDAVVTSAGRLKYKAIIHVAGIGHLWVSTEHSIRRSTVSAMARVRENGYGSVAFPLIGAGTGGTKQEMVLDIMRSELEKVDFSGEVCIVIFKN